MKEIEIKSEEEALENPSKSDIIKSKTIKIVLTASIIAFLIYFIGKLICSISFQKKSDISNGKYSDYKNLLPKLKNMNIISSLDDIFNARQLYINEFDITVQYVKHIRPINETEEAKYKSIYTENETLFTENRFSRRKGQYNYTEFVKLCQEEKLIDQNKVEINNNPLVSIILCSYNNKDLIIKSVRSIQNQSLKNIEIIIVDDGSTDNNTNILQYLLDTDPRIRVFTHLKNWGLWRSRIDGFLYSRAKYIMFFDPSDFYEDNYVLEDIYNIMEKYNLDSVKMLFRVIGDYSNIQFSKILYHTDENSKVVTGSTNIEKYDRLIFGTSGNIWNRFIRANVFTKGLYLLSDLMLNIYQNCIDDFYFNKIVNKASYNFLIIDRVGYVYYYDGQGNGTPKNKTEEQRNSSIQQLVSILWFEYFFLPQNDNKETVISKIREYDNENSRFQISFFRTKFYLIIDLLNMLIQDPFISSDNKAYLSQLLIKTKHLEEEVQSRHIN